LRGQFTRELRLEAGGAVIQQNDRASHNAGMLAALWRSGDQRLATVASGAFTYAGDSVTAAQAIGALAWRPSSESPWHTEGGVYGAAFGVYQLGRGGNVGTYARERVVFSDGALWAGGAAGHTMRDGISSHGTSVDAGASYRSGDLEASVSWARVRSDDAKLLEAAGIFLERDAASHDLDDRTVALHYEHGRVTVDFSQTWRSGLRATLASQSAFFSSAEFVFTPRVSVAVAAGRQLADPVRGVPDVQIVSGMLRLVVLPWRGLYAEEVSGRAHASLSQVPEGTILIVAVAAGESQHVEVAGSFSGWEPVALRRTGDGWEARIVLGSGRHRVAVRIDGGPWRAPANLPRVRDEFGGASGLIVVP
jgi:hypothetical protein